MAEAKIVISASDQTKAAIESAKKNLAGLGQSASTLAGYFPAISAAIAAAFSAQALKGAVDMLDRLDDLSEKSGISVESLSALRYAGEASGTSFDQLAAGLKKFSANISEASGGSKEQTEMFAKLGVSVKDANGQVRDTDKILVDVAAKFASYADGAEKSAFAQKVFGKAGQDMIPLLNQGADGIARMTEEGQKLGVIFSDDAAKSAAEFNDNLKKLSLASEAAGVSLMEGLLPSLIAISEEFLIGRKNTDGFMDAILTLGTINPFKSQASNMATYRQELEDLGKAREKYLANGWDTKAFDADIADVTKKLNYLKEMQAKEALAGGGDNGDAVSRKYGRTSEKKSAPSIGSAASSDFSANFLNNLQTQYAALNGTITKTDEVKRQLALSSEKFTQSQKNEALSLAELIDQEKRRVTVEEAWKSTVKPFADKARDMQFEVSLIGKTAEEQARLRFEFELTNKVREQEIEIQRKVKKENLDAFEAATMMYEIERQAQETRIQYAKQAADEYDKQYDALRGLSEGMKDYWRSAERMGENTRNAVQNAFRGMEDAMVNFVKTGKLDFKSLSDSIISDLIRIQVQQSITGPLARAMSGMFAGPSSGGTDYSLTSGQNTGGLGLKPSGKFANGGVMSSGGPLPMNAYSNGGIATGPQLALFGEGRMNEAYVPLPDGRTIPVTMKGGGGSNINVQIINNNSQAQVSAQPDGQGGLTVLVDMVKNSMADDVFNGVGSMPRAMESRYGLRTAGA